MYLLSSKLLLVNVPVMCRYSLCSVVCVSFRTIKEKTNKFVSYYLFTMCNDE